MKSTTMSNAQYALDISREHPSYVDIHFVMSVWEILFLNIKRSHNVPCVEHPRRSPPSSNLTSLIRSELKGNHFEDEDLQKEKILFIFHHYRTTNLLNQQPS